MTDASRLSRLEASSRATSKDDIDWLIAVARAATAYAKNRTEGNFGRLLEALLDMSPEKPSRQTEEP